MIVFERKAKYQVDPLLLKRWSSRAMSDEAISAFELMSLIDAAHWAPSSYNNQPWRFIYAYRDTPEWTTLFNLLAPTNQVWIKNGAALLVIISRNNFEYNNKPSRTHSFDTGAAMENFALQGAAMNLVVHGLEGFDYDKARTELHIPEDYTVEAMYVVGKKGSKEYLPEELQKREQPNERKSITELIYHGYFGNTE